MLETGWDEATLLGTSTATVRRMRQAIYARAMAPELEVNVDDELKRIYNDSLTSASAQKKAAASARTEAKRRLGVLRRTQAAIRTVLHLDDPEPIPPGAE
jgi:hypothetical protein